MSRRFEANTIVRQESQFVTVGPTLQRKQIKLSMFESATNSSQSIIPLNIFPSHVAFSFLRKKPDPNQTLASNEGLLHSTEVVLKLPRVRISMLLSH